MKKLKIDLSIGACQDVLKDVPDNTYDSCITDPPYGLGKEPDPVDLLRSWIHDLNLDMGPGFMGRSWDQVPTPLIFREILRVVKPESRSAFFAGTRTLHLMMASLRFAGFEIEGVWSWAYGSGFPKNHSVYKALNKKVAERYGKKRCECRGSEHYQESDFAPEGVIDTEQEAPRRLVLDDYEDHDLVTRVCSWCALPDQGFIDSTEGLGTALKPAWEPIVVVKKPVKPVEVDFEAILQSYGFDADEIQLILTPPEEDN